MRTPFLFCLSLAIAGSAAAQNDPVPALVEATGVRAIVKDGKHNAFTAMVKWQGAYWLSFRKAESHESSDGDIIVLRSEDTQTWTDALRLKVFPDNRDPQFLATEKRLFLYDPSLKGKSLATFVTFTDDGKTWSTALPVYKSTYILWKPITHEGEFFATAHTKLNDGKTRNVHLITSRDGVKWDKVSLIRSGNWESETTIHFVTPTRIAAFLRQKHGSPQASVYFSDAPYTTWTGGAVPNMHFGGHAAYSVNGVNYLFSRSYDAGNTTPGLTIYTFDETAKLTPYCKLPAGGDCSYPSMVVDGKDMVVAYYSSHEGPANIYLCRVPLAK